MTLGHSLFAEYSPSNNGMGSGCEAKSLHVVLVTSRDLQNWVAEEDLGGEDFPYACVE